MNIDPFFDSPLGQLPNEIIRNILSKLNDKSLVQLAYTTKSLINQTHKIAQEKIENFIQNIWNTDYFDLNELTNTEAFRYPQVITEESEQVIGNIDGEINYQLKLRILRAVQKYGLTEEQVFEGIELNIANLILFLGAVKDIHAEKVFERIRKLTQLTVDIRNRNNYNFDTTAQLISSQNRILMHRLKEFTAFASNTPGFFNFDADRVLTYGIVLSQKMHNQSLIFIIRAFLHHNGFLYSPALYVYLKSYLQSLRIEFVDEDLDKFVRETSYNNYVYNNDIVNYDDVYSNFIQLLKITHNKMSLLLKIPSLPRLLFLGFDINVIKLIGYDALCQIQNGEGNILNIFKKFSFLNWSELEKSNNKLADLRSLSLIFRDDDLISVVVRYNANIQVIKSTYDRYVSPEFIEFSQNFTTLNQLLESLEDEMIFAKTTITDIFDIYKQNKSVWFECVSIIYAIIQPFVPAQFKYEYLKAKYKISLLDRCSNISLLNIIKNINYFEIFHHPFLKQELIADYCCGMQGYSNEQYLSSIMKYQRIAEVFNYIGKSNVDKLLHNDYEFILKPYRDICDKETRAEECEQLLNGSFDSLWELISFLSKERSFIECFLTKPPLFIVSDLINKLRLYQLIHLSKIESELPHLPKISLLSVLVHPQVYGLAKYYTYEGIVNFSDDIFSYYYKCTHQAQTHLNTAIAARLPFFGVNSHTANSHRDNLSLEKETDDEIARNNSSSHQNIHISSITRKRQS